MIKINHFIPSAVIDSWPKFRQDGYIIFNWNKFSNYDFPKNALFYGYNFCENVQQIVSDLGRCTTFNPWPLSEKNKTISSGKIELNYPVNKSKEFFENGMMIIIDTAAFGLMKSRVLDAFPSI